MVWDIHLPNRVPYAMGPKKSLFPKTRLDVVIVMALGTVMVCDVKPVAGQVWSVLNTIDKPKSAVARTTD